MMKLFLVFFFAFFYEFGIGQIDTLNPLTVKQIADSVYRNLDNFVGTGKLYNRMIQPDTTISIAWNTGYYSSDSVNYKANSDNYYALIHELKYMSIDTSTLPDPVNLFANAMIYANTEEFEEKRYVFPLGVVDFNYQYLDQNSEIQAGRLSENNYVLSPNGGGPQFSNRKCQLIAPCYDFFVTDSMGFVFKREFYHSNRHDFDDIINIRIFHENRWVQLQTESTFLFKPKLDSVQSFVAELTYLNGEKISNHFEIRTPELTKSDSIQSKGDNSFPGCTELLLDGKTVVDIAGNQLEWCWIPRCNNTNQLHKPYLLLTGYRPPLSAQSFEKTYQYYNDEHGELIEKLRMNGYDVIIVRFNIHAKPFTHGLLESAGLLARFIELINENKDISLGHENVIQGSSMSADIANLALLTMEKKHLADSRYPPHHSRLFIAYDANFYGANIPLAYQYQIISHVKHPAMNNFGVFSTSYNVAKYAMSLYLYSSMEQKTVKELLQYHAYATDPFLFWSPVYDFDIFPKTHRKRLDFYDALNAVDNHERFIPLPNNTRNIAISLGKISGLNSDGDDRFNTPAEEWIDINLLAWRFRLAAAKYNPNGFSNLFIRRKTGVSFTSPWNSPFVHHKIDVAQMQEVDNASGSYLPGLGNLIAVGNWTYFPISAAINYVNDDRFQFPHKATVSALGINKNLWPSNGSMSLNMQDLGLMFESRQALNGNIKSNYYGYPNLGRPNDHFSITPFEAIYVDKQINPHIRYIYKEDFPDVPHVTDFILNEVEPWYLGLQNNELGSKVSANYRYHSYRRAKHQIVVGKNVTPTTDIGDYVVEANGKLTLKAGDFISIQPGTHFKAGAIVHIVPEYEACNVQRMSHNNQNTENNYVFQNIQLADKEEIVSEKLLVYPNPVSERIVIETESKKELSRIEIFNLSGRLLQHLETAETTFQLDLAILPKGIYLLKVWQKDGTIHTSKIQKL